MRSKLTKIVLAGAGATLLLGASGFAQAGSTDEGKRKVKTRVSPAYPELAKRMAVTGKVKIEINHTYPLAEAQQVHRDLESRKTTGSTIMLP